MLFIEDWSAFGYTIYFVFPSDAYINKSEGFPRYEIIDKLSSVH